VTALRRIGATAATEQAAEVARAASGPTTTVVNGSWLISTRNDGVDTDQPPKTVSSATCRVCEAGASTCSNEAAVSW
jgi:hypothetical protein